MRAKLCEVQHFERGQESKVTLGIGKSRIAKEMLDNVYEDNEILSYKINSLDNIEIFFSDTCRNKIRGSRSPEPLYKWIIKFIELPSFIADPYEHKGSTWIDEKTNYAYWSVYKRTFYINRWPDSNKIELEREIDISKKDKDAEKKAKLIVDAFNKEFEPIYGFEVIEKIKIPIEEI